MTPELSIASADPASRTHAVSLRCHTNQLYSVCNLCWTRVGPFFGESLKHLADNSTLIADRVRRRLRRCRSLPRMWRPQWLSGSGHPERTERHLRGAERYSWLVLQHGLCVGMRACHPVAARTHLGRQR